MSDKREKIIELVTAHPEMTVRELAHHSRTDRDTVKEVLVEHLVQTRGTLAPSIRRIVHRLDSL